MTNVPRCVVTLSGVISQGVAYAASFDPVSKLTFGGGQFFDAAEWLDTLMLIGLSAVIYALWPSNRQKFAKAARAPLEDGDNE